jgi:hypothetical protein
MRNVEKWRAHTNERSFATEFNRITTKYREENELRTEKIETFLIEQAIKAGVVIARKQKI